MIEVREFGRTSDGTQIELYKLTNQSGASASVITYGAAIQSVRVPDRSGKLDDVVLGCDDAEAYEKQTGYLGATLGRCCSRIAKGEFMLNGQKHKLTINSGDLHLHGGACGFDKKVFAAEVQGEKVVMRYTSPDGEEGYPGTLSVEIQFSFSDDNELCIEYSATCDKDTICALTNHTYFNLKGHGSGDIWEHRLKVYAKDFTELDSKNLPTGRILPVDGTPMDFQEFRVLSDGARSGNFAFGAHEGLILMAELEEQESGRVMEVYSTKPGLQHYAGYALNVPFAAKDGVFYVPSAGTCLEPQFYSDAINFENFPSPVLKVGETYSHITKYRFAVK